MKKGFDFWISNGISSFLKKYWMIYFTFFLLAIWLTIITKNPFVFFIVGFLPCPIIWIYRAIHNPYYNLEEDVANHDPGFYKLIVHRLNIKSKHPKQRITVLYSELIKSRESSVDQRIVTYVKNNKRINQAGMISFSIWFFTFMIFVFVLFFNSR